MKLVKKEYVKYLEWAFKLAYLLLGLVTFNAFLYDSPVQPLLVKGCLILGALALLGRMIYWKDYVKTPYLVVLVLFCASFGISILVNWKYGAGIADMKWMIWTGFLFFLLYMCDTKREKSSYKKEFHFFSHVLLLYSGGAAAVSLYLMQTLYHAKWFTSGNELMLAGFYWGRLWGVYTDPNYGGVLSTLAVLLCLYHCMTKKSWKKIPYVLILAVNYGYILFADSRTAELALALASVFWLIFAGVTGKWAKKTFALRVLMVVFAAVVFIGGGSHVKTGYSEKIEAEIKIMDAQKQQNTQKQNTQAQNTQKTQKTQQTQQTERAADLEKDVTNGRIALWKSGLEIWQTSPVVGTGYNSFLPYVREKLPDTYAVHNSQEEYVSLHNEYLNIMVYQGLLGIGIFLAFGILVFCRWGKNILKTEDSDRNYIGILSACILVVAVAMGFLMEGLYTNSPAAFVLWTFLGYLMQYMQSTK